MLLEGGAPVDAVTRGGSTALHRAAHQGRLDTVQQLLAAGADPSLQARAP